MNLIMITPRVGKSDPLLAFIPNWISHIAKKLDNLFVITPRAEIINLPNNVFIHEIGRDYSKGEHIIHAVHNFHNTILNITHNETIDGIFALMYPKFAIIAAPYARFKNIPLALWYTHDSVNLQLRIAGVLVDKILTATPETCQLVSSKIEAVGRGIDTTKYYRSQRKTRNVDFTITTVGRISPIKKIEVIIKSLIYLQQKTTKITLNLLIVGSPPRPEHKKYLKKLKDLVRENNLEELVEFTGSIEHSEIAEIYEKCDVFINACTSGFDKAILEAMAFEVPVVVCNPAFKSLLGEESDFLMFTPDDPEDLATCLVHLSELSDDNYMEIGHSMRKKVLTSHKVDNFASNIVNTFISLNK